MRVVVVGYPMLAKRQWQLCSRFEAAGVDTHIIVPNGWPPIPAEDHPPNDAPFMLHKCQSLFHGNMARYVFPGLPRLLSQINPDIVLTHGEPWFVGTLYAQVAADLVGVPHVVFSWENLNHVPQSRIQRKIEDLVLKRVHGLITGSNAAAARIRSRGFKGPVAEAPQSGVNTEQFAPTPNHTLSSNNSTTEPGDPSDRLPSVFNSDPGERIVLYAGRLDREKGVETLLETVPSVRESVSSARYTLLGEGDLEDELHDAADTERLSGAIDLVTDRQPYDLMPAIYRTADVFVYPSETTDEWAEQFGYSVAEAMSCGIPPVVSDCGSLPWVVGDAGTVVPERDSEALARGIVDLLTDNDRRKQLSSAARKRVISKFGLDSVAATQLAFLADIASEPKPSLAKLQ